MFQPVWFGKYLLLDKIARGGMAEIYLAKLYGASGFEKELVIKRILPEWSTNESFLAMLIDEAKLAVLLNHSNIVQIYELGKEGEDHYIAMEYVEGVDLRRLWEKTAAIGNHLPPGISLYIMGQVLDGLSYAHRRKNFRGEPLRIIHRDISPHNILISFDGAVKLTDFGIAKATLKSTETVSGIHKGKFAYMSPEQANLRDLDQSSDLFSAGIVFYELLTGQRLFGGGSDIETLDRIRKSEVRFRPEDEARIPQRLREIVLKALEREPSSRFQDAASFGAEVGRFVSESGLTARRGELDDFMEGLFSDAIRERKKRNEERREMEKSLTIALPSDATRIFVTQPGQSVSKVVRTRLRRRRRLLIGSAGAAGLILIALFLARNFFMRPAETEQKAEVIPSIAGIGPRESEGPRELGAIIPRADQPPPVLPPTPPPSLPRLPPPLPRKVTLPRPAAPAVVPPEKKEPPPAEGPGFLSVLAIPWAYVSIDGGEKRESPVIRLSLESGRHLVKVFYAPESLTLDKSIEVKPGFHVRCMANFGAEKKGLRCRD